MRTSNRTLLALAAASLAACGEQPAPTSASSTPTAPLFPAARPMPSASQLEAAMTPTTSTGASDAVVYSFDELPFDCSWDRAPFTYRGLAFAGNYAVCESYAPGGGFALIPANSAGGAYDTRVRTTNEIALPAPATEASIDYYTFADAPNHLIAYGPDGSEIDRATDSDAGSMGTMTVRGDIRRLAIQTYQVGIYLDRLQVTYARSDTTAPVITPVVSGPMGASGWYTGDVTVSWTITDDESRVSSAPCAATTLTEQTDGAVVGCTATSGGGSATATATIRLDRTAPVVEASVAGPLGDAAWYTGDATVTWTTSDDLSGASSCEAASVRSDGTVRLACTSTNGAGLATSSALTVKRDATAPVVAFRGATSYTVADSVDIGCTATDATSGVVSSTCSTITGNAYDFALGETLRSATAVDAAGNTGRGTVRFTVTVSVESLVALLDRWMEKGAVNALGTKLRHGDYDGFRKLLGVQAGKAITAERAAILVRLSKAL